MILNSIFLTAKATGEGLDLNPIGTTVVFVVLIIVCAALYIQSKFFSDNKSTEYVTEDNSTSNAPVTDTAPEEVKLINTDEKTAAIIMAIISDETKLLPSQLNFSYIKLLDENA